MPALLLLFSLSSAACLGLTLVLEKRLLLVNSCGSWAAFQLLMGGGFLLSGLLTAAVVLILGSGKELLSFPGFLSGLCFSGGFLLVVYSFRHAELSWCMALAYIYPLPAAALGWLFLGEGVSFLAGLGLLLAVLGGVFAFLGPGWLAGRCGRRRRLPAGLGRAFPALLASTILVALGLLLARAASADSGELALLALRRLGLSVGPLLLGLRLAAGRDLGAAFRSKGTGLGGLAAGHWAVALAGDGLLLAAVAVGPLAAAGALSVSRVAFAFLFTAVLEAWRSGFLGEAGGRAGWLGKAAALTLVLAGGAAAAFF